MKRIIVFSVLMALLSACAPMPTQQQIDSADYGKVISQNEAEFALRNFFQIYLKDPDSARYSFGPVYKGYSVGNAFEGRKLTAGYLLDLTVNAKNSFGGYVGAKPYKAIFQNGRLVHLWEIGNGGVMKTVL